MWYLPLNQCVVVLVFELLKFMKMVLWGRVGVMNMRCEGVLLFTNFLTLTMAFGV